MYVITGKRKEDSMIPYVEFNYEWRQKQSEPKHVSAQLNQTAAPFKYLSFFNGQTYLKLGYQHAMCIQKDIFG